MFRRSPPSLEDDALETYITHIVAILGYTILVWDHVITLQDEIELIWNGHKGLLVYLFLFNRYFTPLSFIGNLIAYFSTWSPEQCSNFVRYEGACTIIAIEVTALMMLLRVMALYKGEHRIIGLVISILFVETAVNAWLMTRAQAVEHNSEITSCTMIFDPNLRFWPSLSAWLPLIYDTTVIALTLYRCGKHLMNTRAIATGALVRTLMKDGLLYYSVIFVVNLILAIMIVAAPAGVKNIAAQLEQLLTVAMMSRITLSLRREARNDGTVITSPERASLPNPGVFQTSDNTDFIEFRNRPARRASTSFVGMNRLGRSRIVDNAMTVPGVWSRGQSSPGTLFVTAEQSGSTLSGTPLGNHDYNGNFLCMSSHSRDHEVRAQVNDDTNDDGSHVHGRKVGTEHGMLLNEREANTLRTMRAERI